MRRKGIVLAGGTGSRLHPITLAMSKQLVPIHDKPMVLYPIATLMTAGLSDLLIITTPHEQSLFRRLLGDGGQWGISLRYATQAEPKGIAQALLIARDFLAGAPCALALGDNLLHGEELAARLRRADAQPEGATIFAHWVAQPQQYGVVELDDAGRPTALEEKPRAPKSHDAIPGLYFYDGHAPEMAAALRPSARGELEITDLNRRYLEARALRVERLGRGYAWFDAGTPESLLEAAQFVHTMERHLRTKIGCPEEIAFRRGLIDGEQLRRLASAMKNSAYGAYLEELAREAPSSHPRSAA